MEYNRNTWSIMDGGTALSLEMCNRSITLYWVIMCCSWAGGGAFGCPDPEVTSGIRMYSLKNPSGRALPGTSQTSYSG